jgi:mono/diheme cytochrome c family protein
VLAVAAAVGLAACGSDSSSGGGAPAPAQCTPPATRTATFTQVYPILTAKCGACHGTAWGSPDRATAYAAAKAKVDVTNPPNSLLLQKGDGRVSHAGGDQLDPAQVTSLTAWIQECALDDVTATTTR